MFKTCALFVVAVLSLALSGCGSGKQASDPPQNQPLVKVALSPQSVTLLSGAAAGFTATVTGATDTSVHFRLDEANGGNVTASGAYTAPATPGTFHVVAVSVADPTQSARATVTVQDYANAISVHPSTLLENRIQHTASVLMDGSVVFFGGYGGTNPGSYYVPSAERLDSTTGTIVRTARIDFGVTAHSATTLLNGMILFTGGYGNSRIPETSAFLYEPFVGPMRFAGSMVHARRNHTSVTLNNAKVLVTGGMNIAPGFADVQDTAELFDVRSGTFSLTGSMSQKRRNHTATLLNDGRVLIVGGSLQACDAADTCPTLQEILDSAEIYNPGTGQFTSTGSLNTARYDHTATLLPDGRVLIAGGSTYLPGNDFISPPLQYEIYDPAAGKFTDAGFMVRPRRWHSASLLGNGKVLIAAGLNDNDGVMADTEIYNPATRTAVNGPQVLFERARHSATLLPNGKVVLVGGTNLGQSTNLIETFE